MGDTDSIGNQPSRLSIRVPRFFTAAPSVTGSFKEKHSEYHCRNREENVFNNLKHL